MSQVAVRAPGSNADSPEFIGQKLRDALPGLRLHSLSLHDGEGDVVWLSEGVLGPDEHGVVLEAMSSHTLEPNAPLSNRPLGDGRNALIIPARAAGGAVVGAAMVIVDSKQVSSTLLLRLGTPGVRDALARLAARLQPASAAPATATPASSAPPAAVAPAAAPVVAKPAPKAIAPVAPAAPAPVRVPAQAAVPAAAAVAAPAAVAAAVVAVPAAAAAPASPPPRPRMPAPAARSEPAPARVKEAPKASVSLPPPHHTGDTLELCLVPDETPPPGLPDQIPTLAPAGPPPKSLPMSSPKPSPKSTSNAVEPDLRAPTPAPTPVQVKPPAPVLAPDSDATLIAPHPELRDLALVVQQLLKLRSGGRTRRYEVLLRSRSDPARDAVPATLVQAMTAVDANSAIDRHVLTELVKWLGSHPEAWESEPSSFTVNLSLGTLRDRGFLRFASALFDEWKVTPGVVGFEIPEHACLDSATDVRAFVEGCEKLGSFVVLDDFTMHSSAVPFLASAAVRVVKIEARLTMAAMKDKLSQAMVIAISQASKVLGVHCVAKRIESSMARQWLSAIGIDFAQGFALERPQTLDALLRGSKSARKSQEPAGW